VTGRLGHRDVFRNSGLNRIAAAAASNLRQGKTGHGTSKYEAIYKTTTFSHHKEPKSRIHGWAIRNARKP